MAPRPGRHLLTQLVRFALVGGCGFVVDVAIFNVLRSTVFSPEHLHEGPVLAKVVSTSAAIVVNWLGNRHWTFRADRVARSSELPEFVLVSLLGMGVGLTCLWVSHYLLGFTSVFADNVSSNGIGLVLGSALRFWLYRSWVYRVGRARPTPSLRDAALEQAPGFGGAGV